MSGQRPPEGHSRHLEALLRYFSPVRHRAHQVRQRTPDEAAAHLARARRQRALTLASREHLVQHRSHLLTAAALPHVLRVPVQEGEAEERRLAHREEGQLLPEDEEGLAEAEVPSRHQELAVHVLAQLLLGEGAHRQGEAALAAIVTVERAHRHARHLRQLRGAHVVVAPPRHQLRRLAHRPGNQVLQNRLRLHPRLPTPGGLPRGRNVHSGLAPFLPGGSDMGRATQG